MSKLSYQRGRWSEQLAACWLQRQGCRIIDRNFRCPGGELDLVALHDQTLLFIEVRQRRSNQYGSAAESVTPTKQRRIRRAAEYFLLHHPHWQDAPCRFDVLCIDGLGWRSITWIPQAFD